MLDLVEVVTRSLKRAEREELISPVLEALRILAQDYSQSAYAPADYVRNRGLEIATDGLIVHVNVSVGNTVRDCLALKLRETTMSEEMARRLLAQVPAQDVYVTDQAQLILGIVV